VPVAKVLLDLLVMKRHVHHDLGDAMARQVFNQILHQWLAQYGHHGFWQVLR
jgi:hypothetical protein